MIEITDAEFEQAAGTAPKAVLRYLRARGWEYAGDFGRGQLWELRAADDPGPPFQVLMPLDQRVRDYPGRIVDLLETLSAVEGRRPAEILREMSLPPADWQYLRLVPPGPSGTAPLVDLVPALAGLRDLMTAAAAATVATEPQPVQPAQKPQKVKEYVASVRLDQTRVGSYVVAAHTPLSEPPLQPELPLPDVLPQEPFERLVSRRLYAGVVCAHQAAERSVAADSLDDFARYAHAGLSANLCEALVRIAGEERRGYELSFAWAADLPVEQDTPPVAIGRRLLGALEEGAKDLRARLGRRGVMVRGTVVRLRRESSRGPGEVTVSGYLVDEDDRTRRVRMTLGREHYDRAAFAHKEGHEVVVRGDLEVRGTAARMERVADFTVHHVYD